MKILTILISFLPCLCFGQLHLLNDEFENASTLNQWQNITTVEGWEAEHLESFNINTTLSGKLHMMPFTSSWYEDWRGALLFKEVTGDFIFTTEVTVTNRAGNNSPSSNFSLAGPMIRTPRNFNNGSTSWTSDGENYVFLSIGKADGGGNAQQLEVKTTTEGESILNIESINTLTNVQIRIAKVGPYIICLYRVPNQNWVVHRQYYRPDMPNIMQMGLVAYTDWQKVSTYTPIIHNSNVLNEDLDPSLSSNPSLPFNPDIWAGFGFARFTEVTLPSHLEGADLTMVPDADLLSFLGDDSEPVVTNIENLNFNKKIKLFPNPVLDNLSLIIPGGFTYDKICIVNSLGQQVYQTESTIEAIDVSDLTKGIYFVVIHLNNNVITTGSFVKI